MTNKLTNKQQPSQFVRYCVRPITRGGIVGLGITAGLFILNVLIAPTSIMLQISFIPRMLIWYGGTGVAIGAAIGAISYLQQPNDPTAKTLRKTIKWTVLATAGIGFLMMLPTLFVGSKRRY